MSQDFFRFVNMGKRFEENETRFVHFPKSFDHLEKRWHDLTKHDRR